MRYLQTILSILACIAILSSCTNKNSPVYKGLDAISEQEIKSQVEYLASDMLEGRQAGSKASQIAADYISHYLEELNINPLDGEYRQWFESVPFNYVRYSAGIHNDSLSMAYHTDNRLCNILAVIEGVNLEEIIVAGAHYDHIGAYPGMMQGDCIFNGADDNASGTVALMQIAKAFAAMGCKPQKTIILAFWDGEERNCKGSEYFVANYPDITKVRHCINFDMVGRGTADSIACICSDSLRGTYLSWIEKSVKSSRIHLDVTPKSEYDVFSGSDQRCFAELGIPCIWFFTGEHEDVHQPSDEADKINYAKITATAKTAFLLMQEMCNEQ